MNEQTGSTTFVDAESRQELVGVPEALDARIALLGAANEIYENIDGSVGYSRRGDRDRLRLAVPSEPTLNYMWLERDLSFGSLALVWETSDLAEKSGVIESGVRKIVVISRDEVTETRIPYSVYDQDSVVRVSQSDYARNPCGRSEKFYHDSAKPSDAPKPSVISAETLLEARRLIKGAEPAPLADQYREIAKLLSETSSGGPSPSDMYSYYNWDHRGHDKRVAHLLSVVRFFESGGLLPEKFDESLKALINAVEQTEYDNTNSRERYNARKARGESTAFMSRPTDSIYQEVIDAYMTRLIRARAVA